MPSDSGSGEKGLPLPDPVNPGTFVEYHICIPNAWQYRSALVGAIVELCKYWNWQHTQDDINAAQEAAFLFKDAVYGAGYEEACMTFCERMIECINNDADVRSALINALASSPVFQEVIKQVAIRSGAEQITAPIVPAGCDNSLVAGRVIQTVDVLDQNNTDFLEIVEVGTNDEERVSLLIEAIPGLGELPADNILDLFQGFLSDFTENYAAAVTLAWKSEVSEDLYCLAKENEDCTLSYEKIFNYFKQRSGSSLTIASLLKNIIQFVVNGDFSTDDLVASGMYTIQLAFIVAGKDFYGLNIPSIGAVVRDALPSSAWEDWDECVTPPAGPWILLPDDDNPFAPSQPVGTITTQTSSLVEASASLGGDGVYRIALQRTGIPNGCGTITGGSFSGAAPLGDCGCVGWVGALVIFSPGAFFNHFYAYADTPFTVSITY